jgi:hypothetical protein
LLRIVSAPLYKVVLVDFFLADQLTSQVCLTSPLGRENFYFVSMKNAMN